MPNEDILMLRTETIAPGGDALARLNGKPVFIEGAAPNETVCCRITEDRNTWAKARLLEIIEPSVVRVEPACPFYARCGGCNLQHIDYNAQLEIKASILRDSFSRIGGLEVPEVEVIPSQPFEYRNRMQFHCLRQSAKSGSDLKFGLKGRQSGEIIPVRDCPVAVPPIRELLKRAGQGLTLPPEKDRFTVFGMGDKKRGIHGTDAESAEFLNEGGIQRGKINLLDKEIFVDAGLFFQSNCSMLEKLITELQKIASVANRDLPMADLYCGVGTFALFLGDLFPKTILAEENKTAVSLARENLRGLNAEYFALRDTEWPKTVLRSKTGFAVADPPRAGLSNKLAAALTQNGPQTLAYVSCDPSALARDSKILTAAYKLKKLTLFEFYPQTSHIESLVVFEKKESVRRLRGF